MIITIGIPRSEIASRGFGSVTQAGTFRCNTCMQYESDLPIYVLRQPTISLREMWPSVRHFD